MKAHICRRLAGPVLFLLVLALPGLASADPEAELKKAYLKELAFLKAEKRTLEERLQDVEKRSAEKLSASRAEIDRLEGRLLGLRQTSERIEESLRTSELRSETADLSAELHDFLERAREPLQQAGWELPALASEPKPSVEDTRAALQKTFAAAAAILAESGEARRAKGEFFLADGTLVEGEILHLGKVAAYGMSDKGSGALAPAGAGKFRLWPDPARTTAEALLAGQSPGSLRIFLFESTDKAMSPKEERTFWNELELGGVIAWVIFVLGCVALAMILFRTITLIVIGSGTRAVTREVLPMVAQGRFEDARRVVDQANGAAGRVLRAVVHNLSAERARLEDLLQEALLNETPAIERFGSAITVFAAVAPLLGLLGTVSGMIATFDVITEFGTGDPRMLSGGISEALITTKLGLIVAIPALLMGTILAGGADSIVSDLEHAALRVVNAAHGLNLREDDPGSAERAEPSNEPELALSRRVFGGQPEGDVLSGPDPREVEA